MLSALLAPRWGSRALSDQHSVLRASAPSAGPPPAGEPAAGTGAGRAPGVEKRGDPRAPTNGKRPAPALGWGGSRSVAPDQRGPPSARGVGKAGHRTDKTSVFPSRPRPRVDGAARLPRWPRGRRGGLTHVRRRSPDLPLHPGRDRAGTRQTRVPSSCLTPGKKDTCPSMASTHRPLSALPRRTATGTGLGDAQSFLALRRSSGLHFS